MPNTTRTKTGSAPVRCLELEDGNKIRLPDIEVLFCQSLLKRIRERRIFNVQEASLIFSDKFVYRFRERNLNSRIYRILFSFGVAKNVFFFVSLNFVVQDYKN